MKISLIVLFLTMMLLWGILLRAASNNKKFVKAEKVSVAQAESEMEFVPNLVLL